MVTAIAFSAYGGPEVLGPAVRYGTGAAADELVRINARARGQALTIAVIGMAVLATGPRRFPGGPAPPPRRPDPHAATLANITNCQF